jgi:hypothetical protein
MMMIANRTATLIVTNIRPALPHQARVSTDLCIPRDSRRAVRFKADGVIALVSGRN